MAIKQLKFVKSSNRSSVGIYNYICRQDEHAQNTDNCLEYGSLNLPDFAENSGLKFWNFADRNERANAKICTHLILTFPRELSHENRMNLMHEFLQINLANCPLTWAVHDGHNGHNPHGHIVFSERRMTEEKQWKISSSRFFKRNGVTKDKEIHSKHFCSTIYRSWAGITNKYLKSSGIDQTLSIEPKKRRQDLPEFLEMTLQEKLEQGQINQGNKEIQVLDTKIEELEKLIELMTQEKIKEQGNDIHVGPMANSIFDIKNQASANLEVNNVYNNHDNKNNDRRSIGETERGRIRATKERFGEADLARGGGQNRWLEKPDGDLPDWLQRHLDGLWGVIKQQCDDNARAINKLSREPNSELEHGQSDAHEGINQLRRDHESGLEGARSRTEHSHQHTHEIARIYSGTARSEQCGRGQRAIRCGSYANAVKQLSGAIEYTCRRLGELAKEVSAFLRGVAVGGFKRNLKLVLSPFVEKTLPEEVRMPKEIRPEEIKKSFENYLHIESGKIGKSQVIDYLRTVGFDKICHLSDNKYFFNSNHTPENEIKALSEKFQCDCRCEHISVENSRIIDIERQKMVVINAPEGRGNFLVITNGGYWFYKKSFIDDQESLIQLSKKLGQKVSDITDLISIKSPEPCPSLPEMPKFERSGQTKESKISFSFNQKQATPELLPKRVISVSKIMEGVSDLEPPDNNKISVVLPKRAEAEKNAPSTTQKRGGIGR